MLVPINCKLKACTPKQRDKYLEKKKKEKVFRRNYNLLQRALLDKQSVTFCGRNLYVVPSKEHDIALAKARQSVVKFRERKRLFEQLQKENEELMREKQEKETNLEKVAEILKIFEN